MRVFVGLSGGVDSACSAYLLAKEGYEVSGAYLILWNKKSISNDIAEANKRAKTLRIPFYLLDCRKEFKKIVVDYFKKEYERGRTPNPCAVCNQNIKFSLFMQKAFSLGADFIAMGHYVNKVQENDEFYISEGSDEKKDQSYFLSLLKQEQITKSLFPLGNYDKNKVKEIMRDIDMQVVKKSESQEICFIENGHYSDFLAKEYNMKGKEGFIKDLNGNIMGKHKGYFYYTIGQRRGIGISAPYPLYVTAINGETNEVIVGRKDDILKREFYVTDINIVGKNDLTEISELYVRTRYNQAKIKVEVIKKENKHKVILNKDEVITPGQLATFYSNKKVVGGGWIQ